VRATLAVHILGGIVGLVAGLVALAAAKGASLHKKSGMVFVYVMLTAALTGMVVATVQDVAPAINVPAALLTSYLVVTALTTIRPLSFGGRWLDLGGMAVAIAVSAISMKFGIEAVAAGGTRKGMPAFPFFMFAAVGLLAGLSDIRVIRSGALRGASRLARHLWRMCFALFIAALSFFIGQADVFPKAIRIPGLLALPVVTVLVTMVYWLWRVRVRRSFRGIVGIETRAT
jgi:hypothetical protein